MLHLPLRRAGIAAIAVVALMTVGFTAPGQAAVARVADSSGVIPTGLVVDNVGAGGYSDCGGLAPVTATCSTGAHDYFTYAAHGFYFPGLPYTGTVSSVLSWSGGARAFTCVLAAGLIVACNGQGTFPPPLTTFTQTCVAAGAGSWACYILHD